MFMLFIGCIFHIPFCYYMIYKANQGITGLAIATNATYFLIFILITVYSSFLTEIQDAWFLPNLDTFYNLGAYMALAIPGTFMLCLEWWCYEIITIFAGLMSVESAAT